MKIGIITHYYKSENYGGNLQAYALCEILRLLGYEGEQISYDSAYRSNNRLKRFNDMSFSKKVLKVSMFARSFVKRTVINLNDKKIAEKLEYKKTAMLKFNQSVIPHSTLTYNKETILNSKLIYDIYITGSDQVWNPKAICPAYLLDFVPKDKIKFSYAASISKDELTPQQLDMFRKSLADYIAVSVREENAVELLQDVSPVPVEWVLDPTLLLTNEQWDEISSERVIEGEYIFCYFLGGDKNERKIAEQFAEQKKLPIVTLPYLLGHYRKCDKNFGDIKLFDVSPNKFISLIKHAKYVFTDSFHAAVFSGIYQKEYYIFNREGHKAMSSRIYSLTSLFETEDHFCDTPEKANLSYILKLPSIDYSKPLLKLEMMQRKSMDFLKNNLLKAEDLLKQHEA